MRPVTQAEIREMLAFPRSLMRARLPTLDACPHATNFDAQDKGCQECYHHEDCAWLARNDECGVLDVGSVAEVIAALDAARTNTQTAVYGHRACRCPSCAWLKRASKLMNRLREYGIEPARDVPEQCSRGAPAAAL